MVIIPDEMELIRKIEIIENVKLQKISIVLSLFAKSAFKA